MQFIRYDIMGKKTMNLYIIDDHGHIKLEKNVRKWGKWCQEHQREMIISKNEINGAVISTVFLGVCINKLAEPILYETMVFGHKWDRLQYRYNYSNKADALIGHAAMMDMVRKDS
jgi:hypothetical protein